MDDSVTTTVMVNQPTILLPESVPEVLGMEFCMAFQVQFDDITDPLTLEQTRPWDLAEMNEWAEKWWAEKGMKWEGSFALPEQHIESVTEVKHEQ